MPATLRTLVVDANSQTRKLTCVQIRALGHHADEASDGPSALRALEGACYDVLLTEIQLPALHGLDLARRIRERGAGSCQPRIIALTGEARAGDREHCLAAGIDDYLARPVGLSYLKTVLERGEMRYVHAAQAEFDPTIIADLATALGPLAPAMLRSVAATFARDTPARLGELRAALARGDCAAAAYLAHLLRGRCLTLGINSLAAHCADLELRVSSGDPCDTGALAALEGAYRRATTTLTEYIGRIS